ncbi:MAG: RecQ family ATP-dependent DNA helicase [Anaerolineae bacterium]
MTTYPVLAELGFSLDQVSTLSSRDRTSLLNFLLRWEHVAALHACLDILMRQRPDLVSLMDLRTKALMAEARFDEAVAQMQARLEARSSMTARALLARIHLAQGEKARAREIAEALVTERPEAITAWRLLVEVELARGETEAALEACRRLRELRPHSRSYLLSMLDVSQAREDWVTASGYAVQLLNTVEELSDLSVEYLERLRSYFQASGEATRVADLDAALQRRYVKELAALRTRLHGEVTSPLASETEKTRRDFAVLERGAAAESLPALEEVPVSEEERQWIADAVQKHFGFTTLLPGQVETLACVLRGEDVLAVLPTGGGKSLCYQLPALLAEQGVTLVISPLIALMKDQLDSLPDHLRPRATTINSSLDGDELRRRLDHATDGTYRLLYAAPERLRQPTFLHAMRRAGLNYLVVDEAHCVSAWGHDFRPDYLALGRVRAALGNPQLVALTATAPPPVRQDIIQHLHSGPATAAPDVRVVAGDITRPNLRLEVLQARNLDEKLRRLLAFCQAEEGSGIVYAGTRARCERLAALLRRYGVAAQHYHAGIRNRAEVQDAFMAGRVRVVVATVAFGLGIDKPDIRFIVHFVPPSSLEAYYQEAGRAGRDGLPARCLLMYSSEDRATLTRRLHHDALSIGFLRKTYGAVQQRLGDADWGRVCMGNLERELQVDDVRIRVALSLLEESGLLRRGPDVPRAAQVRLSDLVAPTVWARDADFAAFRKAARLRPAQWLTLDLADVARKAGLSLHHLETQLLTWSDKGWLNYHFSGRDLFLEVLPPPQDAAARVEGLLERYATVQAQRVAEITAYARTSRCRHGYINAYLGGRVIERCEACDNCMEVSVAHVDDLPDERAQLLTILRCMAEAPWSWGRRNLIYILCADSKAPERGREQSGYGALAFRSKTAVKHLLASLERAGFVQPRELEHGGVVLDLMPKGRAALEHPALLDPILKPSIVPASRREEGLSVDDTLLDRLRAWRTEQSRIQAVPPYVIFHDSHLRAIAAARPQTLEALQEIKGIGPKRLEAYGEEILQIIKQLATRNS